MLTVILVAGHAPVGTQISAEAAWALLAMLAVSVAVVGIAVAAWHRRLRRRPDAPRAQFDPEHAGGREAASLDRDLALLWSEVERARRDPLLARQARRLLAAHRSRRPGRRDQDGGDGGTRRAA